MDLTPQHSWPFLVLEVLLSLPPAFYLPRPLPHPALILFLCQSNTCRSYSEADNVCHCQQVSLLSVSGMSGEGRSGEGVGRGIKAHPHQGHQALPFLWEGQKASLRACPLGRTTGPCGAGGPLFPPSHSREQGWLSLWTTQRCFCSLVHAVFSKVLHLCTVEVGLDGWLV